jgi:hypothetical protein
MHEMHKLAVLLMTSTLLKKKARHSLIMAMAGVHLFSKTMIADRRNNV